MQLQPGDNSSEGCKMWLVSRKILVVFDILVSYYYSDTQKGKR